LLKVGLTPLHWAIKRDETDLAMMILHYKPDLDKKDLLKRPPLYFAVLNKNLELIKALLIQKANPWSSGMKEDYMDICEKDARVVYFIQKFRNVRDLFYFKTFYTSF
jgi:ankyrin repeat protein